MSQTSEVVVTSLFHGVCHGMLLSFDSASVSVGHLSGIRVVGGCSDFRNAISETRSSRSLFWGANVHPVYVQRLPEA